MENDGVTRLPDGSAFFVASFPLPKDHWLYQPIGECPAPMLNPSGLSRAAFADEIRQAAQYAIRGATQSGKITDFDPDALTQNLIVALLGPWGDLERVSLSPGDSLELEPEPGDGSRPCDDGSPE